MTFEQLLKRAAEEANENELVTLTVNQVRSYLSGTDLPEEVGNALDWQQGPVYGGEATERYVLIKIIP